MNDKRFGFTLAEVLITLGIVGIVAALTLPLLVKKYQMNMFEVAFKKQYSVLNNTINYLQLDKGLSECYITVITVPYQGKLVEMYAGNNSECSALKKELITNLKLTPIEKYSTFTTKSKLLQGGGTMVNGSVDYDDLVQNSKVYLFPDGAVILFRNNDNASGYEDDVIIIDVNGQKGPNKWGYDVFCLTLVKKNGIIRLTDEFVSLAEKGGKLPRTILLNKSSNNSNLTQYGLW